MVLYTILMIAQEKEPDAFTAIGRWRTLVSALLSFGRGLRFITRAIRRGDNLERRKSFA